MLEPWAAAGSQELMVNFAINSFPKLFIQISKLNFVRLQ